MRTFFWFVAALLLPVLLCGAERVDGRFDRTLSVSGPVDLDATTNAGGIVVTRGTAGSVRVQAILEGGYDWFWPQDVEAHIREIERHPPIEQTGNTVRIGYIDRHLLDGVSMRLEIEVPADTRVQARANSGGVHVSGVRGPVECRTNSGGIELRDIEGDAVATANSGGIRMLRVEGAATAHANSGGVEAFDVGGVIDAHTNSGGIRLSQTHAAAIRAQATSGGVWVALAPGQGYDINAESISGRISAPEMTVRGVLSRRGVHHSLDGKVRGGGPEVTIRSVSGPVRID
jgi:hypothetical protein